MALPTAGGDPEGEAGRLFGLSLCAGAAGLDLALHIACEGYRTVGYVEREAYAAAVLVARMEDTALDRAPVWDDIATFDGSAWRGVVDILTAGYPCQPFSLAGRRLGASDTRHLWPHVARIAQECRPPFVFLENVANHLRLGFPEVAEGLVSMGYRLAAGLFTAAEVGAPHRRERLFILACDDRNPMADPARLLGDQVERREPERDAPSLAHAPGERKRKPAEPPIPLARGRAAWNESGNIGRKLADADGKRRRQIECGQPPKLGPDARGAGVEDGGNARSQGRSSPARRSAGERAAWPPGPGDRAGWRRYLRCAPDLKPAIRRGTDGLAFRVDRLRLCGNGVAPLVAAYALRTLAAELAARPCG